MHCMAAKAYESVSRCPKRARHAAHTCYEPPLLQLAANVAATRVRARWQCLLVLSGRCRSIDTYRTLKTRSRGAGIGEVPRECCMVWYCVPRAFTTRFISAIGRACTPSAHSGGHGAEVRPMAVVVAKERRKRPCDRPPQADGVQAVAWAVPFGSRASQSQL